VEELEDGSQKTISKLILTSRGNQLIITDNMGRQLIQTVKRSHQLTAECLASHPQLAEDQLTYTHSIQILSKIKCFSVFNQSAILICLMKNTQNGQKVFGQLTL
jgi:hypothetical protein